jgi:uncharacterized RDD family membrane protein YckC
MKCPKCGYLGFAEIERCRNCGYDFSLSSAPSLPELPLRLKGEGSPGAADGTSPGLDDLSLVSAPKQDLDRVFMASSASQSATAGRELPLFGSPVQDDEPLIKRASPPRAPLAVRRATPEVPRVRAEQPRPQSLDLSSDVDSLPSVLPPRPMSIVAAPPRLAAFAADGSTGELRRRELETGTSAAIVTRLGAVLIDLIILAAVDVLVVYFTMQICGISTDELGMLPLGPLVAFILVQNGGYLVAFTAGGQTLGKMAAGIRVVSEESDGTVDFGRAMTRTIIWMILAIPAGLGFLTLFNQDRRGLHDRFAGTRVVRASA